MKAYANDECSSLRRDGQRSLLGLIAVSAVLGIISLIGLLLDRSQFGFSYLLGFSFVASLGTGALFWVMIHHITGAVWSVVFRRFLEKYSQSLTLLLILFIPILLNAGPVYRWITSSEAIVVAKQSWLNLPFFAIRGFLYLAVWCGLAWWMVMASSRQDAITDRLESKKMHNRSALGLIILAFTTSYASFDWLMTLDPAWSSTIFGVYFWAGGIIGSLALLTLSIVLLHAAGWLRNTITAEHFHDLGKLMFGFIVFWAYIAFSQYFLIWYANLPEETSYFIQRRTGSWNSLSWSLVVGHFVVPFVLLLPRTFKRNPQILGFVAAWILAFHYVDIYWQVMPVLHPRGVQFHWLDLTLPLAMLSGTLALSTWFAIGSKLIPVGDPRLGESLSFQNP